VLRIRNLSLSPAARTGHATLQARINGSASFDVRVRQGKRLFKARNRQNNRVFREVRLALRRMSRGPNRCMYCEDSSADQIDHFRPKDFYPEAVFVWENYLWSCGRCNRRKNNSFLVIRRS
jgi:5-methylcytosine-specific restriction endonuclease McrA